MDNSSSTVIWQEYDLHKHVWKVELMMCLLVLPIPPHPFCQIITTFLRLHKDDGFVLLFCHNLFHQLNKSVNRESQKDRQDTHKK